MLTQVDRFTGACACRKANADTRQKNEFPQEHDSLSELALTTVNANIHPSESPDVFSQFGAQEKGALPRHLIDTQVDVHADTVTLSFLIIVSILVLSRKPTRARLEQRPHRIVPLAPGVPLAIIAGTDERDRSASFSLLQLRLRGKSHMIGAKEAARACLQGVNHE